MCRFFQTYENFLSISCCREHFAFFCEIGFVYHVAAKIFFFLQIYSKVFICMILKGDLFIFKILDAHKVHFDKSKTMLWTENATLKSWMLMMLFLLCLLCTLCLFWVFMILRKFSLLLECGAVFVINVIVLRNTCFLLNESIYTMFNFAWP